MCAFVIHTHNLGCTKTECLKRWYIYVMENNCVNICWNLSINVEVVGQSQFDVQVWPWPWAYLNKCFKWHIYSWWRKIMCKFILKSIQNCRSYGQNKSLAFKWHWLGPTWTNVSNGRSTCDGERLCQIILKSIDNFRSYGAEEFGQWMHTMNHRRTHIHWTVIVTIMSHSL